MAAKAQVASNENQNQSEHNNHKKPAGSLRSGAFFSKKSLVVIALVFAAIGVYILRNSFAATTTILSQNKPTSASTTSPSAGPSSAAVDGSTTTRWSSVYADPQWFQVDLGGLYNISEVKLNWEVAYGKAYQIQTSTDGSNWQSIYNTTTGDGGIDDLTGLNGMGRYVRMYGTVRGTQWGYSLWEFQVFGAQSDSGTASFTPVADTYVSKNSPTASRATATQLVVDSGNSVSGDDLNKAYLKFDLSTLAGKNVTSAKLRLFVDNPTTQSKALMAVTDPSWPETMTWNSQPTLGAQVGSTPALNKTGVWDEVDLASYVKANVGKVVSFDIEDLKGLDGYAFDSREAANHPQLVVSYNAPDIIPPTVALTAPASSATVSGSAVNIAASATDNVGVTKVDFMVDSAIVNTDTIAPYAYAWNSTKTANGTHVISAKAYDAAGNGATTSVSVTVNNPVAAPSRIYWGGFIEGKETYAYYYGNPAPNAKPWGNAPWDNTGNTWDRFESNAGKKVSIMAYGQPPPWAQTKVDTNALNIVTSRGAIPYITMGQNNIDDLAAIAAGTYDSQIKTWATNIKAVNKPIFLRLWWEMNGSWYSWGNTKTPSTTYVAAWKHVHDLVVGQGATNITWVWCPNIFAGTTPEPSPWYPGDAYVDWTCVDGYNKGTSSISFSTVMDTTYKKLVSIAPTKPIVVGETESLEYGSGVKAAWLKDMLQTQLPNNYPQIKALLMFNWREYEKGAYQPFPIESSASAQQAFHDSIQNSYYAAGGTFTLPTGLTKVKPL
jgi:beta-mannanase